MTHESGSETLSEGVKSIIELESQYVTPSHDRLYPIFIKSVNNATVEDVDGRKYVDFAQGSGCVSIGFNHPELVETVRNNAGKLSHTGFPYSSEVIVRFAKKMCEVTPGNYPKKFGFALSGMEAVDGAFKLARWYTRRPQQVAFIGAHAGFTGFSLAVTAHYTAQHAGFHPVVPGTIFAPYPYCYRCPLGLQYPDCGVACLDFLENYLMRTVAPPENLAAVFFEPFLGPGGMSPAPPEYVRGLREICDKHSILFVADEVLTGIGKTGKMYAMEHFAPVEPDITVTGKGLGNGMFPVSGYVARREIMSWKAGAHTSTYHGYALGSAVGLKVLEIIERDRLTERAASLGDHAMRRLREMMDRHQLIGDVRGKGLFIGVELVKDRRTKEPAKEEALRVAYAAYRKGLILQWNGLYFNVFKMYPNLNIPKEDLDRGLDIFEESIDEVEKGRAPMPPEELPSYYLVKTSYK